MNLQNEPKSVEDYRDVVKILKLKIIKQSKRIQQLQLKNKAYEEQINSAIQPAQDLKMTSRMLQLQNETNLRREQKQVQINTLKGKAEVMDFFAKGLKRIGITPQSVFRIADITYKSYVQADQFREVLVKIKLGLTQKEISCLIFIFDQACSSFITKQDYINSLLAYKIGTQDSYHQFTHECLFKFSQMIHSQRVNLLKFYEEMEGRSNSKMYLNNKKVIDLNVFGEQIKNSYGSKITQREIVALFYAIDLQSQGYLQKNNFLYTITSYLNKILTGEQIESKRQHEQQGNGKSQLTIPLPNSAKKADKISQNLNQTSKIVQFVNDPESCAAKIEKQFGISISQVYQELMSYDFKNRLSLKSFKKICLKFNVDSEFLSQLYKEMDTQFKGSLYFNELINYYLAHSNDSQMILRLLGRYFQVSDLDSEKFWFMFGLSADSQISKNKFAQILKKNFESPDQKLWQNFWGFFDKGRGTCSMASIIKAFKKYQS